MGSGSSKLSSPKIEVDEASAIFNDEKEVGPPVTCRRGLARVIGNQQPSPFQLPDLEYSLLEELSAGRAEVPGLPGNWAAVMPSAGQSSSTNQKCGGGGTHDS